MREVRFFRWLEVTAELDAIEAEARERDRELRNIREVLGDYA